jgi:tetratricopeptide (TPR) repeat protein
VRKHTDSLEAYDSFLRGVEYQWHFTKEDNARARQLYEKAVALDPQYAEAYTSLGFTYLLEWINSWSVDPQTLEGALALAQQALTLDDSLPVAHSRLGMVYAQQKQYEQAIAEGERAIALDPNNADSYAFHGEVLRFAGRPEDALRMLAQAMRLNPRYPPLYLFFLGLAYNMAGRYPEAVATLKEHISRSPNNLAAHLFLAEAVARAEQALRRKPIAVDEHLDSVGAAYYLAGRPEEAIAPMKQYLARYPNILSAHLTLATVYSELGREAEARTEAAEVLRLNPNFSLEVHKQRMPIKDPAVLERHIAALRKMGLK